MGMVCRKSCWKVSKKRKGVSPVVSTIIISAILLIILVVAAFVSTNILEMQVTNTEFEQAKSSMLALNQVIQDVALRPGSGSYLQFNQRSGGIGAYQSQERVIIETSEVMIVPEKLILRPNAAGTYQNWGVFGVGTHWDLTRDNNTSTGVEVTGSTNVGLIETENLDNITLGWDITSVTAHLKAKASGVSKETFNPLGNTTLGSTQYVSGNLSDLKADDGAYMRFRSYYTLSPPIDIVKNGNITTKTNWTYRDISNGQAVDGGYNSDIYNSQYYSIYIWHDANNNTSGSGELFQTLNDVALSPISAILYFYFRIDYSKTTGNPSETTTVNVVLEGPNGSVNIFSYSKGFSGNEYSTTGWIYTIIDITNNMTTPGTYTLKLQANFSANKNSPKLYVYFDDIKLDVRFPNQVCEVEFTGSSNTANWIDLTWTTDLAWNASNVNTTIQLYNYTAGAYPTSGQGYQNYISGNSNTDETKTGSITINPTNFRDSNTNWKIKIRGEKTTTQPFELKVDLIKIEAFYEGDVKATIIWVIDGGTYPGPEFTISREGFTDYNQTLVKNPITNQEWNWAAINNLEIGANVTKLGEYETLQVSEFWVEVEYQTRTLDKVYDSSWYGPLYSLIYRGGSRTASAEMVLAGTQSPAVGMSDQLGFVRVNVGDGVRIILDYNRVRVVTNSIVVVGDNKYNFTEISFIRLETGALGGSGTINLKIQNVGVNTFTRVYNCNYTVLYIKIDRGDNIEQFQIKLESEPGIKTAIVFTETVIRISMG